MNKYSILVLSLGVVLGFGAAQATSLLWHPTTPIKQPIGLEGELDLMRINSDGTADNTGLRIPYDVTGTYPGTSVLLLSPDKTKVLYSLWKDAKIHIYIANIDGSNSRQIAEQHVPEGSGELETRSLKWSADGNTVMYTELVTDCKGNCASPDKVSTKHVDYSVTVR